MNTLEQLFRATQGLQQTVNSQFAQLDLDILNYKPSPDSWSVLECLEHLNRYSNYYNQAIAKAIATSPEGMYKSEISYSWIGKKFLVMMRPQNMKKHKTLKHMNPNNSKLGREVMVAFQKHQDELLALLEGAKSVNLNKMAIPVEFFKLLKIRIGETLGFNVVHEERHVQQALRVKQQALKQIVA
ncbi:DinB family protein [Pontibacter silvestris]|uniref:DinB family protein n=1 Tax=Pontibacter silvestris TaxID=2305183 RepID=A0ABW4X180_9BACT|nr:DinB family protein [Pontibacter silvestris]MCC9135879.1 DinB family protein [Pontibacter silvestris]